MIIYMPCRAILTRQEINHKSCHAFENWLSWKCLTSVIKRGLVFPSWHHLLTSFLYTMDMTFDSYSVQASSHASMVGLMDGTPPIQLSPSKQITVPSSQALSERKESQCYYYHAQYLLIYPECTFLWLIEIITLRLHFSLVWRDSGAKFAF